jgi:DNA modification methylase
MLGWEQIPITLRADLDEADRTLAELEENLARKDLTWQEQIENRARYDELMREKHGEGRQGLDTGGWTLKKTAEALGVSDAAIKREVRFAKKLRERPDLAKRVSDLPLNAAIRKVKQLIQNEKTERLRKSGKLKLGVDLRLGDARELIKEVKDGSVSLLLTDPPFGLKGLEDGLDSQGYKGQLKQTDNMTHSKAMNLLHEIGDDLVRVLKPGAHFYIFHSSIEMGMVLRVCLNDEEDVEIQPNELIWDKGRTTNPFLGYRYQSSYEMIMFGHRLPRKRRLANAQRDILTFSPVKAQDKLHPFEKPQELLRYLIRQSTDPGDLILDPFAGSGAILEAAKALGRRGVGFEIDKENYHTALSRLSDDRS